MNAEGQTGGIVISSSGAATGPNDSATLGARRPKTYWVAHLALILAAAASAAILAGRGYESQLLGLSIGVLIVLAVLFLAQIVIARRAGGVLGNGIAYALSAAGVLCMLVAKFVAAESLLIALTILSAVFFVSAIVAFVFQVRRTRPSQ